MPDRYETKPCHVENRLDCQLEIGLILQTLQGGGGRLLRGRRGLEHGCLGVTAQRAEPPGIDGEQGEAWDASVFRPADWHLARALARCAAEGETT